MGYGLGVLLLALGLILVFAIRDTQIGPVEVQTLGWIIALAGVLIIALTAAQLNRSRRSTAVTRHSDGTETISERRDDAPPAV